MAQQHGLFLAYDQERDGPPGTARETAAVRQTPLLVGMGWREGAIHYMLRVDAAAQREAFVCPWPDGCQACEALREDAKREPGEEG